MPTLTTVTPRMTVTIDYINSTSEYRDGPADDQNAPVYLVRQLDFVVWGDRDPTVTIAGSRRRKDGRWGAGRVTVVTVGSRLPDDLRRDVQAAISRAVAETRAWLDTIENGGDDQ